MACLVGLRWAPVTVHPRKWCQVANPTQQRWLNNNICNNPNSSIRILIVLVHMGAVVVLVQSLVLLVQVVLVLPEVLATPVAAAAELVAVPVHPFPTQSQCNNKETLQ